MMVERKSKVGNGGLRLFGWLAALAALTVPVAAAAQPVVIDLSHNKVAVDASYSGTKLLLFGAIAPGNAVAVVVDGPKQQDKVSRKKRTAGVWANGPSMVFDGVPGFYWIGASAPLAKLAPAAELTDKGIGLASLQQRLRPVKPESAAKTAAFRAALIKEQTSRRVFADDGKVSILGGRLFRADLTLPSDAPIGSYLVRVFVSHGDHIVGEQVTRLKVERAGLISSMYEFSRHYAALYGIFTVLLAGLLGWGANMAFRKR